MRAHTHLLRPHFLCQVRAALRSVTADMQAKGRGGGGSDVKTLQFWQFLMQQALENAEKCGEVVSSPESVAAAPPPSRAALSHRKLTLEPPSSKIEEGETSLLAGKRKAASTAGGANEPSTVWRCKKCGLDNDAALWECSICCTARARAGASSPQPTPVKPQKRVRPSPAEASPSKAPAIVDVSGMTKQMPAGNWTWQEHVGPSGQVEMLYLNPPGCQPSQKVYSFDLDGRCWQHLYKFALLPWPNNQLPLQVVLCTPSPRSRSPLAPPTGASSMQR